jgi:hypothetical protein
MTVSQECITRIPDCKTVQDKTSLSPHPVNAGAAVCVEEGLPPVGQARLTGSINFNVGASAPRSVCR